MIREIIVDPVFARAINFLTGIHISLSHPSLLGWIFPSITPWKNSLGAPKE
jgi:hypothetical protein